jgi:predicted ester cyclase
MSVEGNKEVIRKCYDFFKRGEYQASNALYAPGFVSHRTTGDISKDELAVVTRPRLMAFSDMTISIEHLIGEGDLVSFREIIEGTHTGEFMDIPPTGKKFVIINTCTMRVIDGQIIEAWTNLDDYNLLQQLGVVLDRNEATKQIKGFAEKIIKAEIEALYVGNFGSLEALYDINVISHHPALPDTVGWKAVEVSFQKLRELIPDNRIDLKYLTGEGNLCVLSYKSHGTFTGKVEGFPPPTGKELTEDALQLFRLENGKIVEVWLHATVKGLT